MVSEILVKKNCTMPVKPLRYSFYPQRATFVQFLKQLMSLQIAHEQVKVLDHPKLQVLYFEYILAYFYILFEKHVNLTLYIS